MGNARIDLHMHTTVSDGTDTPEKLLENVRAAGIGLFSVTDHDSVKAAHTIRPLLSDGDSSFIPGVEFSCRDEEGKYHILGYGFDPASEAIVSVVEFGHEIRMKKVRSRLELLSERFGISFPDDEVEALLSLENPGKPHIANLLVKHAYSDTISRAIKEYLDPLHVKSEHVRPEQAIAGILGANGVPVLAHPFYGSGDELILGEEMEQRLCKLIGFGLRGIEAFYSGFTEKLRNSALELAEKHGLYVTAGSDYHGTNKLVKLGDTGLDDVDDYPDGLRRFIALFEK